MRVNTNYQHKFFQSVRAFPYSDVFISECNFLKPQGNGGPLNHFPMPLLPLSCPAQSHVHRSMGALEAGYDAAISCLLTQGSLLQQYDVMKNKVSCIEPEDD